MDLLSGTLNMPIALARRVRSYFTRPKENPQIVDVEAQSGKELLYVPGSFVQLEHGRTHYILLGPPKGKLIVFSHGVSLFSFVWLDLARKIAAQGYQVLLYDFYGHGFSTIPTCSFTIDLFCCQLEQLLIALGLLQGREDKSMILIGHSMGGFVSSEIAARYKDLISHLILLNVVGIPVQLGVKHPFPSALQMVAKVVRKTSALDQAAHALAKLISFHTKFLPLTYEELCSSASSLDEEARAHSNINPTKSETPTFVYEQHTSDVASSSYYSTITSSFYSRVSSAVGNFAPQSLVSFGKSVHFLYKTWMFQLAVNADRSRVLLSVLRDCPLLDADHSITYKYLGNMLLPHEIPSKFSDVREWSRKLPILIIWGLNDSITPPSLIEDYQRYIPHAKVVKLSRGDHSLFLQRPHSVFQEVAAFIADPRNNS